MGRVIVVSGPPGAGKSTVAERLADVFDPSAVVAGDHFFAFLRNGAVPPWLAAAHEQNQAMTGAAAAATGRPAAHSLAALLARRVEDGSLRVVPDDPLLSGAQPV